MSIPLDRLYHYIENIAEEVHGDNVIIYRFVPHGSKKIDDLRPFNKSAVEHYMLPHLFCHDQEPLSYDHYEQQVEAIADHHMSNLRLKLLGESDRLHTNLRNVIDINDLAFLLHSEKNSQEVQRYQEQGMIPVYYWSHAIIARDWYRFAEHVRIKKQSKKTFLIYNRAWSGTREYRLKFIEMLSDFDLTNYCQCTLNPVEPELNLHYNKHQFDNPIWKPNVNIDDVFPASLVSSDSSADFEIADYKNTEIEIVLETLFDDLRVHLTEKSLRPIACGQPFILVSTPGSLKYLKSYGFKTFSDLWDESYDDIIDPQQRLIQIVNLMTSIKNWTPQEKVIKMTLAQEIVDYNKKLFFSQKFFKNTINELKNNLAVAFEIFYKNNKYNLWFNRWDPLLKDSEFVDYLEKKNNLWWNIKNLLPTIEYINHAQNKIIEHTNISNK